MEVSSAVIVFFCFFFVLLNACRIWIKMSYFNHIHNYFPFRLKFLYSSESIPFTSNWMRVYLALGN